MAYQKPGGGGVASDEVNATKANVLAGKTALTSDSNDEVATGTMPNNGAQSATLGFGGSKTIPAGYTSGGTVSVSITDRRGWTGGVGVGGTTYIPEGYHNGNGYVYGPSDGNLVANNIRSGISIFGVWGSVSKWAYTQGTYSAPSGVGYYLIQSGGTMYLPQVTINNLGFNPRMMSNFWWDGSSALGTTLATQNASVLIFNGGTQGLVTRCFLTNQSGYSGWFGMGAVDIPVTNDSSCNGNYEIGGYY